MTRHVEVRWQRASIDVNFCITSSEPHSTKPALLWARHSWWLEGIAQLSLGVDTSEHLLLLEVSMPNCRRSVVPGRAYQAVPRPGSPNFCDLTPPAPQTPKREYRGFATAHAVTDMKNLRTQERTCQSHLQQLAFQIDWNRIGRRCQHKGPMALAPLIIRWGGTALSDLLRQSARLKCCSGEGADLQHPRARSSDIALAFDARPEDWRTVG